LEKLPQLAVKHYREGYNCAQSLLLAYGLESGLDLHQMVVAAESFGVGMGRQGETCGAVAGALMIIGLKHGSYDAGDARATETTYEQVRQFCRRFTGLNQSIVCRELLGYDIGTTEGMAAAVENGAFTVCPKYVRDAASIVAESITEPQAAATQP
jgi:C_GCAxxG_C_C family probable redox protein